MSNQRIEFTAKEVDYGEAGDIVQISFDEAPEEDPMSRTKRYFMISQNYEFPDKPTLEWHNGMDYDAGSEIIDYTFTRDLFEVTLKNGLSFYISHHCSKSVFISIQAFLGSEYKRRDA